MQTPNDFGENGVRPTHPGLLDYLAHTLLDHDWHIKPLQRMIVLSSTYRQTSSLRQSADKNLTSPPLAKARPSRNSSQNSEGEGEFLSADRLSPDSRATNVDPENRFLWKFPRRRLTSEEIRDAMLAVSGSLNLKVGGQSVIVPVDQELIDQLYKPSQWQVTPTTSEHHRRSVYLLAKRNLRLPFMETFDQPAAQTSCAVREQSTHAPQALELLNGRLANQLSIAFANRLRREAGSAPEAQVELAYQLAAGRPPTDRERELAIAFIGQVSLREFALAVFNLNDFLYVN